MVSRAAPRWGEAITYLVHGKNLSGAQHLGFVALLGIANGLLQTSEGATVAGEHLGLAIDLGSDNLLGAGDAAIGGLAETRIVGVAGGQEGEIGPLALGAHLDDEMVGIGGDGLAGGSPDVHARAGGLVGDVAATAAERNLRRQRG